MNSSSHRLTMWTAVDATAANDSDSWTQVRSRADAERSSTLLARSSPQTVAAEHVSGDTRAPHQISSAQQLQARGGETDPSHQTTRPARTPALLLCPGQRVDTREQHRLCRRLSLDRAGGHGCRRPDRGLDRLAGPRIDQVARRSASCPPAAPGGGTRGESPATSLTMCAIDPSGWRTSTRRSGCSDGDRHRR